MVDRGYGRQRCAARAVVGAESSLGTLQPAGWSERNTYEQKKVSVSLRLGALRALRDFSWFGAAEASVQSL